jgi:hypothetical protein
MGTATTKNAERGMLKKDKPSARKSVNSKRLAGRVSSFSFGREFLEAFPTSETKEEALARIARERAESEKWRPTQRMKNKNPGPVR